MTVIAIMAGFSFGYCIVDIVQNYRSAKRIDNILKEFESKND